MKRLLLLVSLIITVAVCKAQNPKLQGIDKIPPFKILRQDSTWYTPANLKKDKPVMIIYFSPDCSHCQHMMYELEPKMKAFSKAQIIMVTFTDYNRLQMIRNFYRDFNLAKFPNIIVGTEAHTYLVQKYYHVSMTPYIAIYNKSGHLVRAFDRVPSIDTLAAAVKKG